MNIFKLGFIFLFAIILAACSDEPESTGNIVTTKKVKNSTIDRNVDLHAFSRGQKLYLKNCSACHGKNAEGSKDWRKADDDGKYPAPPLNGTAHTWHHSTSALMNVIRNGTGKIGGNMPAWKDKLTNAEITDILVWVKAQWPDEIYAVWYKNFHQEK